MAHRSRALVVLAEDTNKALNNLPVTPLPGIPEGFYMYVVYIDTQFQHSCTDTKSFLKIDFKIR